jgi:hypothetical protein
VSLFFLISAKGPEAPKDRAYGRSNSRQKHYVYYHVGLGWDVLFERSITTVALVN